VKLDAKSIEALRSYFSPDRIRMLNLACMSGSLKLEVDETSYINDDNVSATAYQPVSLFAASDEIIKKAIDINCNFDW
jgi:hypothetical protein